MTVRGHCIAFAMLLMLLSNTASAREQSETEGEPGGSAASTANDNSWELRGQVVDHEGRPIANVDVSTVWTANGVTLEELSTIKKDGNDAKLAVNEGQMEPWGAHPTKTDVDGRFSIPMSYRNYQVLAIDNERKHGAMFVLTKRQAPADVTIELVPLVRLHGRVRIAATGRPVKDVTLFVRTPHNDRLPLGADRFAICSSLESRFEFWLPPGRYQLEAFGHMTPPHILAGFPTVTLKPGQREVESEVLELVPETPRMDWVEAVHSAPQWKDIRNRYGEAAPGWHFADVRGIAKDATISDFEGRWVLLYFWGTTCAPCLGRQLPELVKFYDEHAPQRDRFEIVAVCVNEIGDLKSLKDLERRLESIVKNAWDGRRLPFPLALDASFRTCQSFGVDEFEKVLIDPQGRLVEGDEKTLAEKLKGSGQTSSK